MASEIEEKARNAADFRKLMFASIVSALTFVTGLFWNEAIKSAIDKIVPTADSTFYKFVAALLVTAIAALLVYLLLHSQKLAEERIHRKFSARLPVNSGKAKPEQKKR